MTAVEIVARALATACAQGKYSREAGALGQYVGATRPLWLNLQ